MTCFIFIACIYPFGLTGGFIGYPSFFFFLFLFSHFLLFASLCLSAQTKLPWAQTKYTFEWKLKTKFLGLYLTINNDSSCRQAIPLHSSLCLLLIHKPTFSLTSNTRWVTHHTEVNMPAVCATNRVCKFHTCPIILPPSYSSFFLCLLYVSRAHSAGNT